MAVTAVKSAGDLNHLFVWRIALIALCRQPNIFKHPKEVPHGQQAGLEQTLHHPFCF